MNVIRSERRLAQHDWPVLVGLVQSAIDETPTKRLGKREDRTFRKPLEVMTGIRPRRNMFNHENIELLMTENRERNIEELQDALSDVHKDVHGKCLKYRETQRPTHNKRTGRSEANFSRGDFVVVRQAVKTRHKLE